MAQLQVTGTKRTQTRGDAKSGHEGCIGREGGNARTLDGGVELDEPCFVGGVELGLQFWVGLFEMR